MPKPDNEEVDPIVLAALMDDGHEDEDDEKAKKAVIDAAADGDEDEDDADDKGTGEGTPSGKSDDEQDEDAEDPDKGKTPTDKKPDADASDKDEDEDLTPAEKADQEKQSRKDRREQRRQAFMDSLVEKPKAKNPAIDLIAGDPDYKPLELKDGEEYKTEDLKSDREKVAANAMATGARYAEQLKEQENFWDKVEMQHKILQYDPDLQYLNEANEQEFNQKKADVVIGLYHQLIGYKEHPLFDPQSRQPLIDPQTNKQAVRVTVNRTDLSWLDFAKGYTDNVMEWAEDEAGETTERIASQRATQGIRPGGGRASKRGKPALKEGTFRNMSDEDFDKYDEETDEELAAAFGG